MTTIAQARKIVLSMPEAEEREHMGHPDFRVRRKIFATLWPKDQCAVVKLTLADQHALMQMDPRAVSLNAWSRQGWTTVNLRQVGVDRFRRLVASSWRLVAPKTLVKQHAELVPEPRRTH